MSNEIRVGQEWTNDDGRRFVIDRFRDEMAWGALVVDGQSGTIGVGLARLDDPAHGWKLTRDIRTIGLEPAEIAALDRGASMILGNPREDMPPLVDGQELLGVEGWHFDEEPKPGARQVKLLLKSAVKMAVKGLTSVEIGRVLGEKFPDSPSGDDAAWEQFVPFWTEAAPGVGFDGKVWLMSVEVLP